MTRAHSRPPSSRSGRPTIAAVAQRAGVSIATVSRVVNGVANKASAETIARVNAAIRDLDYRPESAGRTLRIGQSRLVAVLAANLANPTMAAIAATVEMALRERGLVMLLCDTHDRPELQDEYLLEMRAHRAHVTVLLGAVASPGLDAARPRGDRLLFVNRLAPGDPQAPFVGIDNKGAAVEVAEALVRRVSGPLALLHGSPWSSATGMRIEGFVERTRALGRAIIDAHIFGGTGDHLEIGYRGAEALLASAPRPAGIFCTSDLMAYGAHRRLSDAGLQVPQDVVVFGFDDNPLNDWIAPWLSSVRVPYADFGPAIADAVQALSLDHASPVRTILRHQLVQR
ncbi:MAG: LacI family DNA-binding transcriptional regulator [Alphaproteobacteria bacterium]|nr:LacI family DNA-binding transcriptional regulator [Alphaproteobacteria bacterium]